MSNATIKIIDFGGDNQRELSLRSQRFRASSSRKVVVQLLSTKIVHFYDKSTKLCQITTNPKTNIFGYGAKPNSTLDTNTAQALKWPT